MAEQPATEGPTKSLYGILPPEVRRRARRLAWLYLIVGVALLPWIGYLAESLPKRSLDVHYRLAWVGFDCFLVWAIARTAYLGFRVDARVQLSATAAATLLIVDAWFDITTSHGRGAIYQAVILAVFAELPAAMFSLYVAHRVNRRWLELAHLQQVEASGAQAVADDHPG